MRGGQLRLHRNGRLCGTCGRAQLLRNARSVSNDGPLGATSVREKERHGESSIASCCNTHHPDFGLCFRTAPWSNRLCSELQSEASKPDIANIPLRRRLGSGVYIRLSDLLKMRRVIVSISDPKTKKENTYEGVSMNNLCRSVKISD